MQRYSIGHIIENKTETRGFQFFKQERTVGIYKTIEEANNIVGGSYMQKVARRKVTQQITSQYKDIFYRHFYSTFTQTANSTGQC